MRNEARVHKPSKTGAPPLSTFEWLSVGWFLLDALTHFFMEGPYLWITLFEGGAKNSTSPFALIWKEYGRADKRWEVFDANVLSLEILTVLITGPLAVWLIFAILKRKVYRHFLQVTICVCELYGGWMTFSPEWLTGSPNLDVSDFTLKWIYLFFMNIVWVIIPMVLLWDSWMQMAAAFRGEGNRGTPACVERYGSGLVMVTLLAYGILTPTILFNLYQRT